MKLSLIDTHCDTASELYHRHQPLEHNNCDIDLDKASVYDNYAQYFAVWTNHRRSDEEGWEDFLNISANFKAEVARNADRAMMVYSAADLEKAFAGHKRGCILAVEDARLTAGKMERLDVLKDAGVKYLTLMWSGTSCVGGSHNTEEGLTDFGRQLVAGCFERGILPDVSHASEKAVDEVIEIARAYNKPFIASHSNAHAILPHTRNLRDRHFEAIKELGGVVGINLYCEFVTNSAVKTATLDDIVDHIDHFMELGGQDIIGIGGDLDGCDLTQPLHNVGDLPLIADALAKRGYSDELIEKIFWKNFYDFALRTL